MTARIMVEQGTMKAGTVGPATGDIWLEMSGTAFPMSHWNDFVVVILHAWAVALVRLLRGKATSAQVYFMDGPHQVDITLVSPRTLRVSAQDSGRERFSARTRPLPLVASVVTASEMVLAECRTKNAWSRDAAILEKSLPGLREEASRLARR
jgi:hypothetical protein